MYNKALIPIDLEHVEMFSRAVAVARQLLGTGGGEIHSLYVDSSRVHSASFTLLSAERVQQVQQETRQQVNRLFEQLVPASLRGRCHVREGVIYDEILEEARILKSDVILVAAGRPGLSSYMIGSNAEKVLRHAQCSVFVIRDSSVW